MESKVFDISGKRIWVAGHRGMVGAAVVRRLATAGCEVLTVGREEVDPAGVGLDGTAAALRG